MADGFWKVGEDKLHYHVSFYGHSIYIYHITFKMVIFQYNFIKYLLPSASAYKGYRGQYQPSIYLVPDFIMLKGFIQTANGPSF